MPDRSRRAAVPRRGILKALALAPAALAGCAAATSERARDGAAPGAPAGAPAARPAGRGAAAPGPAVAALRSFAVDPDAEPACVFRAAPSPRRDR